MSSHCARIITWAVVGVTAVRVMICTAAEPEVKLGGAIGYRFDLTATNNLLKLDLEKDFFAPFVSRTRTGGFIGLGKLADAACHFAKHSSDPAVRARKDAIIDFIIRHQTPEGYTGFFAPSARLKKLWDLHEMGFIVQGLMADWELFGNDKALAAAKRNCDHVIENWANLPDGWEFEGITDRETTLGFGFGVARLYAATRDERYRTFLRVTRGLDDWNAPITIGRDKMIYGQAYGYTGTCLEQLELYTHDPRPRYLETSLRALDFQTKGDGVLIDGNGGIAECWTNDQDGEGSVGETCNAAFELLFWDKLIRLGVVDTARLGDLMERTIYNALFAAQSADGRRLRYYTPLNGVRSYWKDDLYCCPNNFRRAIARLPEYVFYTRPNEVYANLFTSCEATLDVGSQRVRIAEETTYPADGRVTFRLTPERTDAFVFKLRIPRWCERPTVRVNGKRVTYECRSGTVLALPRVWRAGDVIEADFPMMVRTVRGRKRQSGRFAVMRGPVVYAMDTRKTDVFAAMHPYDVQTVMMMNPKSLEWKDGTITALVSTQDWAVGVADVSVDGKVPENVRRVTLLPFEHEDNTLTYFRAPNLEGDVTEEDTLFTAD